MMKVFAGSVPTRFIQSKYQRVTECLRTSGGSFYYHYFGKNDGMDITEMNGGCVPCACAEKQELSFPTMDGLLQVIPGKPKLFVQADRFILMNFVLTTTRSTRIQLGKIIFRQNIGYTHTAGIHNMVQ
jgi:hypothetical protein